MLKFQIINMHKFQLKKPCVNEFQFNCYVFENMRVHTDFISGSSDPGQIDMLLYVINVSVRLMHSYKQSTQTQFCWLIQQNLFYTV